MTEPVAVLGLPEDGDLFFSAFFLCVVRQKLPALMSVREEVPAKICAHGHRGPHGRDAKKMLQNTHKKLHRADLGVLFFLSSITRAPALSDAKTGEDKKKRDSNKNIFV